MSGRERINVSDSHVQQIFRHSLLKHCCSACKQRRLDHTYAPTWWHQAKVSQVCPDPSEIRLRQLQALPWPPVCLIVSCTNTLRRQNSKLPGRSQLVIPVYKNSSQSHIHSIYYARFEPLDKTEVRSGVAPPLGVARLSRINLGIIIGQTSSRALGRTS